MYLVSAWSFQHGFLDYVNRTELNKLEALARALQSEYAEQQSWDYLEKNRRHWNHLLDQHLLNPVELNESTLMRSPFQGREPAENRKKERVILLNHQQKPVVGTRYIENQAIYKPIMYNNRIVGYLGIEKKVELSHQLDRIFSQQQQLNLVLIALGSILISIVIALPFSSRLIKPIVNLLKATLSLTKGDYTQRVGIHSKDEIGQLSKAFNDMAENLQKQEHMQRRWLADISHELRTPLAVAKAETEAMLDGVRAVSTENLQSLHQEINHLNALVEDLYELSRYELEVLKPNKKTVSIAPLLQELLKSFSSEFKNRGLEIECECPNLKIHADPTKLTQVFINLIQNNLRYTREGGKVFIKISKQGNNIRIQWEDDGPGVSESNLDKLFDRLFREDESRASLLKGSGLGLSICKSIIESHHGKITAYLSGYGGLGIDILLPQD